MLTLPFIYYHFHYFDFIFLLEVAYHLYLDIKSDLVIENCTSDLIIYYGHIFLQILDMVFFLSRPFYC